MKRSPALIATLAIGGALMAGSLSAASAAPADGTAGQAATAAPKTAPAKATTPRAKAAAARRAKAAKRAALRRAKAGELRKLKVLNGRYTRLGRAAATCPAAVPALRATRVIRANALKGTAAASPHQLRTRQVRLAKAIVRLARASANCVPPAGAGAPIVPGPAAPVAPPAEGAAPAPGTPTTPATPGTPGAAGTPVRVDVPQSALLAGLPIDLSDVLGTTLPDVLTLVPLDDLTGTLCQATGVLCVGLDPASLSQTLNALIGQVPLVGPLLQPLLSPVLSLLTVPTSGDLTELFELIDLGGGMVQLVPSGLLGTLLTTVQGLLGPLNAALGGQTLPLGLLQIP